MLISREQKQRERHKCRRKLVKRTRADTPIAHRNFLSIQPLVTAMRHDTLNTLGNVTISRANSSVITSLIRPHRHRQRRDKGT